MSEHSDHKDGHGEHKDDHGHGDAHGKDAHGHGHGGHHHHDSLEAYVGKPKGWATPEQLAALDRIAKENAKKIRGKTREAALREIEALQKDEKIQKELGPLILELRKRIIAELQK